MWTRDGSSALRLVRAAEQHLVELEGAAGRGDVMFIAVN